MSKITEFRQDDVDLAHSKLPALQSGCVPDSRVTTPRLNPMVWLLLTPLAAALGVWVLLFALIVWIPRALSAVVFAFTGWDLQAIGRRKEIVGSPLASVPDKPDPQHGMF